MKIKNMSVSTRLILSFLIILLAFVILGGFTYFQMRKSAEITRNIYKHPYTVSNAVRDIEVYIISIHRTMKDVILAENESERDKAIALINEYEQNALKKFEIVFDRYLGSQMDIEDAHTSFLESKTIRSEVIELINSGDRTAALAIIKNRGAEQIELIIKKITALVDFADQKVISLRNEAYYRQSLVTRNFIMFFSIILITSIASSYYIIRSVSVPVSSTINRIKEISRDQFHIDIEVGSGSQVDLLSQSVNQLEIIAEQLNKEINDRISVQSELEQYKDSLEKKVEKRTLELKKYQDNLEVLVAERTVQLEEKNKKLEEFNKLFIGREFRVKELKDKIVELERELNKLKGS